MVLSEMAQLKEERPFWLLLKGNPFIAIKTKRN
jgi:hypothetical protein